MNIEAVSVVGVASLDVTWNPHGESKMRLGGVVHACRGLWALGAPFRVYYIAPEYLAPHVQKYLSHFGADVTEQIGLIKDAPAVMLVGSPQETAAQKYEFLMRDELRAELSAEGLARLSESADEQCVVLAGEFAAEPVLNALAKRPTRRIHVDLANVAAPDLPQPVTTLITSTSCEWFLDRFSASPEDMSTFVPTQASRVILKENRGGSRLYDGHRWVHVGAQLRPAVHSVGVGDCFDAVFAALERKLGAESAAGAAAWVAAEYASTTEPDHFMRAVRWLAQSSDPLPQGVVSPWETRPEFSVYIAAPDFDYLDTSRIDALEQSLRYHNFRPRRPIKENGQASATLTPMQRRAMYYADLRLLSQCQCVVAFATPEDPGTHVEIGRAAQSGIPVILYDPDRRAGNLMLVESATAVATTLDEVLVQVFTLFDHQRRRTST